MIFFWKLMAKLHGENFEATPKEVVVSQMNEPRALPMGRTEFETWSDRIISGALLNGGKEDPEVFRQSQKFALANALMHIGPTESHKPDAHFIHGLRVAAIKQVALERAQEIRAEGKARAEAEEAKAKEELAANEEKARRAEELKTQKEQARAAYEAHATSPLIVVKATDL